MAGPFDSIVKELLLHNPASLLQMLNLPVGEAVTSENTDLSTSSRSADILLKVAIPDYLVQIEMQTTYDQNMPKRLLEYRVLCGMRYETLPQMQSVLLLMRPAADGSALTGLLASGDFRFTYQIVRLWELDVEAALSQPVHLLPMAPLCAVPAEGLPHLLLRMQQRLQEEAVPSAECREIWARTRFLLGLKMSTDQAETLMGGIMLDLRDSTTYMATLEEGMRKGLHEGMRKGKQEGLHEGIQKGKQEGLREGGLEEARRVLLRLGQKRLGAASSEVAARIEAMREVEEIESLLERVLDVAGWDELLS